MNALEKLINKNSQNKFLCVGLDSDINKIPKHLLNKKNPVLEFNSEIINATKENTAAYKLNFAFYEADGLAGFETLQKTIELIPEDILIIADAKRGDIGNTSQMYAKALFDHFKCDCSTLHPYMGYDSLSPFLEYKDKLNFILALTSNPGSSDFEKLKLEDGSYLFQKVIENAKKWNENKNVGIVFGATHTEDLLENMPLIDDLPVLLPGVGAQGGSLDDTIKTFSNFNRKNYLINISRGIIFKSKNEDFGEAAYNEIIELNNQVLSNLK